MGFKKILPTEISENIIRSLSQDWMLITAASGEKANPMTAGWGGMGSLWGKPVTFCFVRPQRFTYELMENGEYYTLSFYDEKYKKKLALCGAKSGRDTDKVKEIGFTTVFSECGAPYFEEARLVLVCKKIYKDVVKPECFADKKAPEYWYPDEDYSCVFVGEIIEVLEK